MYFVISGPGPYGVPMLSLTVLAELHSSLEAAEHALRRRAPAFLGLGSPPPALKSTASRKLQLQDRTPILSAQIQGRLLMA